ncbi:MAG: 23S rRNA (guanosine(2251)-2'-O)-methyltransferase RlmB [Brachybacterium sp.]|nr:23S rRNA (guanosine(2251)-2'-O)-methyltransferase RlmB [Brachybacterium sp.]
MAGNSQRRGARRGPKKTRSVGSGGQRRRGLEGRGPTPKAEDRPAHKAFSGGAKKTKRPAARTEGADLVAGRNAVLEALREDVPATALTLMHRIDTDDRIREILRIAAERSLPVQETTRSDLDKMSDGAVHQGVALRIPPYEYADVDELLSIAQDRFETPLLIALDSITDPRNLGAILRSAGAFGAHGVILPERRSVSMTASVWKVAAGAAGRVRVAQVTNLNRTLTELKGTGLFALGLDADGDVTTRQMELGTEPAVLVVGAEGKGLSRLTRETCDQIVSIPMQGGTESLNASVATSIALYEIAGRREAEGIA